MFATLGGKIIAYAPASASVRGAVRVLSPMMVCPAAFREQASRAYAIDVSFGGWIGVFEFRIGHAS